MGDASHPERKADGVDGRTVFSEGVLVGYRWFDKQNIQPLYPFGFGLSHTKFAYSKIKLAHADDGGEEVSFVLQNNGARDGHEVPQVYAMVRSGSPMTVLNSRYGHWSFRPDASRERRIKIHYSPYRATRLRVLVCRRREVGNSKGFT